MSKRVSKVLKEVVDEELTEMPVMVVPAVDEPVQVQPEPTLSERLFAVSEQLALLLEGSGSAYVAIAAAKAQVLYAMKLAAKPD